MSWETNQESRYCDKFGDTCDRCGKHGDCDDKVKLYRERESLLHESCKRKIEAEEEELEAV